jgi:hypothetical protein
MSGGFFTLQMFFMGLPPFVGANDLCMCELGIMKQMMNTLVCSRYLAYLEITLFCVLG